MRNDFFFLTAALEETQQEQGQSMLVDMCTWAVLASTCSCSQNLVCLAWGTILSSLKPMWVG